MEEQKLQKQMEDNLELLRENNKMLKKIRGVQKRAQLYSILKFLFFAALAFGAYIYIKPYMENLFNAYNELLKSIEGIKLPKLPF
jgi:hypothetical protein